MAPSTFRTALLLACSLLPPTALLRAQSPPPIEWQRSFGGTGGEWAVCVRQTSDGGYVVAGTSSSNDGDVTGAHGDEDIWVVKLDASGTLQWQKALGGTGQERGASIVQTSDGGYAVAGDTYSNDGDVTGNHGETDFWVVKLDASGGIEWQKTLGGSLQDAAKSIQQTNDGGYVVAGYAFSNDDDVSGNHGWSDIWVVKLDPLGAIEWQRALGSSGLDDQGHVILAGNNGYLVAGKASEDNGDVGGFNGYVDFWFVRLDALGSIIWQECLGGTDYDLCTGVDATTDEGYVTAGHTLSNDGDVAGNHGLADYWVAKTDALGVLQWQATLGGSNIDYGHAVVEDIDGGVAVAGSSRSVDGDVSGNHGIDDMWVVKLDALGALQWQKSLGSGNMDAAYSMRTTTDGGYIVAGRANANGGDVTGNHGGSDFWVVKLEGTSTRLEETYTGAFTLWPDPSAGIVNLDLGSPMTDALLTITDARGCAVFRQRMTGQRTTIDLSTRPRGLYLVTVRGAWGMESRRLALE